MKQFYLLTKTLLVVVSLLVGGANFAWGETSLFSENFESAETPAAAGWTITGGTGTIETSADASISKYAKFVPSTTNGNRGQSYGFSAANISSAANCWRVEFDAALTPGADRTATSVAVTGASTGNITTNEAASGALYFLCVQSANNSTTYNVFIGNSTDAASASYTLTSGTFYHFSISYDGTKVTVKIGDNAAVSKNVSSATAGALKGLKTCESRGAGVVCIDNIKLYSLTAPAFTLSDDSKTVSVGGSETVNVTDITGTISVSSDNTAAATASYNDGTVTINGVANGVATITVTGTNDGLTLDKKIEVTVGAVSTTTVTVNYLCGGTPIADALELTDVAVGSKLTASEVVYEDVVYGTGCRYANPVLSESLPYTVVENGVINITYTQQNAVSSLNVQAKVNNVNHLIKTYNLTDKYVGDVVTIYYPRFYMSGTTLYSTAQAAHNNYYDWAYTLDGNDAVVEYATTEATNVVYYKEGEDIEGMTSDNTGNANVRCSSGAGGRSVDELSMTTLGTGVYKLCSRVWGSKNENGTYTFRVAGTDVLVHALTGALDDKSVSFSVVSGTAAVKVQGSTDTGGRVLDYVYIQKLDDATVSVYNGDFENSTWDNGWSGTGTNKAAAFAKQTSAQSWGATGNFAEMWTNGSFSVEANLRQILINVPAGRYTLSADIKNDISSSGGVLYAKVGSADDVTTAAENADGKNESVSFNVAATSNVVVGFKTTAINEKKGWIAIDNFELEQTAVSATIGSTGWTTFASAYPLDLSSMTASDASEVTAYYASAVGGDQVTMTAIESTGVAAGQGLMLKGSVGATITIPVAALGDAISGNKLVGCTTSTVLDANDKYFVLVNNGNNEAEFQSLADFGATIPAGKAYLDASTTSGARLSIVFDDATAIKAIDASSKAGAQADGKYLEKGKIVIVKNGTKFNANGQKVK